VDAETATLPVGRLTAVAESCSRSYCGPLPQLKVKKRRRDYEQEYE